MPLLWKHWLVRWKIFVQKLVLDSRIGISNWNANAFHDFHPYFWLNFPGGNQFRLNSDFRIRTTFFTEKWYNGSDSIDSILEYHVIKFNDGRFCVQNLQIIETVEKWIDTVTIISIQYSPGALLIKVNNVSDSNEKYGMKTSTKWSQNARQLRTNVRCCCCGFCASKNLNNFTGTLFAVVFLFIIECCLKRKPRGNHSL